MTSNLLKAKIQFFDINPLGRIITRFSKDLSIIDLAFPQITDMASKGIFRAITVAISVCIVNPYLLIAFAITGTLMTIILKLGQKAMLQC